MIENNRILQTVADYKKGITRNVTGDELKDMMELMRECDPYIALAQVFYYGYVIAKEEKKKGATRR